ncbi:hypothetical protein K435DRAFT_277542 [Dendrothele bispora CBS 962.96]|uniref:Uncharacterized protein n=1 Tax=Dendrothele bispora (strain CBS 962.96) TaxID=1314807 RepID=A0A4S8LMH6_DENBC|nr:hypothetical protein K435DRAFT_277542 [Dendrothele bispora CBS 962.96]
MKASLEFSSKRLLYILVFTNLLTVGLIQGFLFHLRKSDSALQIRGPDHPQIWTVGLGKPVKLYLEDSVHYEAYHSEVSDVEWGALAPGNGMIYLGESHEPFSLSMFHQLRCLNILRDDLSSAGYMSNRTPSHMGQHCFNYLRQMILCSSDLHLTPLLGYRRNSHPDAFICRDWHTVYQKVEENQHNHFLWLNDSSATNNY